jgi:hypothetical protein
MQHFIRTQNYCVWFNLLDIRHKIIKLQVIKQAEKIKMFSEFCMCKNYKTNSTTNYKGSKKFKIYAPEVNGQSFKLAQEYIRESGCKKCSLHFICNAG